MNRIFIAVLAALLLVTGVVIGVVAIGASRNSEAVATGVISSEPDETGAKQPDWLTEYTLTERSGKKFHSKELDGTVHVVNFFFSKCPTSCRTQTASVQSLAKEFGPKGVKFLSITCDPQHDTPATLAQYADEFAADKEDWLFLTGDLPYLRRVGGEVYYVHVDKQTHSESLLVVDKKGEVRGRFRWADAKEIADMKNLLTDLLAEDTSA